SSLAGLVGIHLRLAQKPKKVISICRSTFHVPLPMPRVPRKSSDLPAVTSATAWTPELSQNATRSRRAQRYFFQVPRCESPRYFPSGPISPWVFRKRSAAAATVSVAAAGTFPDSQASTSSGSLASAASRSRINSASRRSAICRLLVWSARRTLCPWWSPSTWKGQLHLSARTSRPPGPKNLQVLRWRRNAYRSRSACTVFTLPQSPPNQWMRSLVVRLAYTLAAALADIVAVVYWRLA